MTTTRSTLVALLATLLVLASSLTTNSAAAADRIKPGRLPYPTGGTISVGAGVDPGNQNAQLADNLPPTIKRGWRAEPPRCPQAGGSSSTSVSVTKKITVVNDRQYQCSWVSAYATSTGKVLWRRLYHFANRAVVAGSTVYVQHDTQDAGDLLDALSLTTGKLRWSSDYVGDGTYNDYAPAVGSGLVMNSVWGVDAKTGTHKLTIPSDDTTSEQASTVITGGRIYINSGYGVAAYDARTGTKLWGKSKAGAASMFPGVQRPAVHSGRVYVTSLDTTLVYDAKTGHQYKSLPGSYRPIAFDGNTGFFTTNRWDAPDALSAVNLSTGRIYWTHKPAAGAPFGSVLTAPVVSNGLVWIQQGSSTMTRARLVALDEVTGRQRTATVQACPPAISAGLATITIAQHRIFTSSDCGVLTYVKK